MRSGASLIEHREFLRCYNHRDLAQVPRGAPVKMDPRLDAGRRLFRGGDSAPESTLASRLRAIDIPERRAHKWMKAAENIFRRVFDLEGYGPIPLQLEHGGKQVYLSEALALDDDGSKSPALDFQRRVFALLEKRSLTDAIVGSLDGEDSEGHVSRVMNGQILGGGGGDRKDYPAFIRRKLKEMTEHLVVKGTRNTPARAREIDADQRASIAGAFHGAVSVWPRWLLELLKSEAARELKLSEVDRAARLQDAARRRFVDTSAINRHQK